MPSSGSARPWESYERPWGRSELIFKNEGEARVTAKILTVDPHSRLSLQKHELRSEYWFVMEGEAEVNLGGGTVVLGPGETIRIPRGAPHRLVAMAAPKCLKSPRGNSMKLTSSDWRTTMAGLRRVAALGFATPRLRHAGGPSLALDPLPTGSWAESWSRPPGGIEHHG